MRKTMKSLAAAAAMGVLGGQAFGAETVVIKDSPVHKIDPGADAALSEPRPVPNTLNAQLAAKGPNKGDFKVLPADAPPPPPPGTKEAAKPEPVKTAKAPEEAKPEPVKIAKAEPKPEPAKAAPPRAPKAPEGPSADFAPSLVDAAGAFAAYAAKAGGIDAKYADGAAIGRAVTTSAAYETHQFHEGMVAYAALVALQEPRFVQAVYDLARDPEERKALAETLLDQPSAVLAIDGSDAAAVTISGVLGQMGADLVKAGQASRKAATDVQSQAWSKEAAPDPQKRLADAKALSANRSALDADQTDALMASLISMRKTGPALGGRAPAPTPVVARGLALAALAVLGHAGEEDIETLAPLLTDAKGEDCVKMAKLNLYQCLAVAGPHYEHAFCLGQHALMDTGQCVISAAGQNPLQSPIPAVTPVVEPVRRSRSVSVPMALSTPAGPERSLAYARPPVDMAPPPAPEPIQEAEPEEEQEMALAVAPPPGPMIQAAAPPPAAAPEPASAERALAALMERMDRLERQAEAVREPARPERYARAETEDQPAYAPQRNEDRYDPYYGRDPREYRQDYDPYAQPYYGRSLPPGYAYRFGR